MKIKILLLVTLFLSSCKERFEPPVAANMKSLLVVEGFINTGGGSTIIRLTRTLDLKSSKDILPEPNASLKIQGEDGSMVEGISNNQGFCTLVTDQLNPTQKYRLNIKTKAGKTYSTDFLESKQAPEIERVGFKIVNNPAPGIQLYVNASAANNDTRYYSWNYEETWEVISPIASNLEFKSGVIVPRDHSINIRYCWQSDRSKHILIGSSVTLSSNRIHEYPLIYIQGNSLKLSYLYSITLYQYGLSKEAYDYLQRLKKNTEQIGSIFDPQPSELTGNIRCLTDPLEKVIGFINAGSVTEKRFFIKYNDIPRDSRAWSYSLNCQPRVVPSDSLDYYTKSNFLIIDRLLPSSNYSMAEDVCVDCRTRGGSNIKPTYWPD